MSRRFAVNAGTEQNSLNPVNTSRNIELDRGDANQGGMTDEQFRDQLYRVLAVNRNILPQLIARSMIDNVNPDTIMSQLGLIDIFKQIENNIQQRFDRTVEMIADNYQRTINMVQNSLNLRQRSTGSTVSDVSEPSQSTDDAADEAEATGADNTDTGVDNTDAGADNTDAGADNTDTGADNTDTGVDNTDTGADNTGDEAEATNTAASKSLPDGGQLAELIHESIEHQADEDEGMTTVPSFDQTTAQGASPVKLMQDESVYPATLT